MEISVKTNLEFDINACGVCIYCRHLLAMDIIQIIKLSWKHYIPAF